MIADLTTLRLGGPARRTETATTTGELVDLVRTADAAGEPVLIIGGGSNLVVGDDGWPGLVVLVRTNGLDVRGDDSHGEYRVDAGMSWDRLVELTIDDEASGLAAMSGIPGLTGATPVQNVGAYGSEVADTITEVQVLDRTSGRVEDWSPQQCRFGFRTSAFKRTDRYVVLRVTFALARGTPSVAVRYAELARRLGVDLGDPAPAKQVRDVVLELRRGKGMVLDAADHDTWSVGSFFVNPLVPVDEVPDGCPHWPQDDVMKLSAAWLIERAGFAKGFGLDHGDGTVALSTKHSLALTNRGGATTETLLDLARVIRDGVEQRHGVRLRPEAHLVGVEL